MKTYLTCILLLIYNFGICQDILSIPDANFKKALINEGIDYNNDGEIERFEAEVTLKLELQNYHFHDISGIEHFTGLNKLIIRNNDSLSFIQLESLKSLKELQISENKSLLSIQISNCPDLKKLNINYNGSIELLDIKELGSLVTLESKGNTKLKTFNFRKLQSLDSLIVENNLYLSNLHIEKDINLKFIKISNSGLKSVDFNHINSLRKLIFNQNNSIQELSFNQLINLEHLDIHENNNLTHYQIKNSHALKSVDIKRNPSLTSFLIDSMNSLNHLEIGKNNSLVNLHIGTIPKLDSLIISNNDKLHSFIIPENKIINFIFIYNNKSLRRITSNNSKIHLNHLYIANNGLFKITIPNCDSIHSLTIKENLKLTNIDFGIIKNIDSLKILSNNALPTLNTINLSALKFLLLAGNQSFGNINFNNFENLKELYIEDNTYITQMHLNGLDSLRKLYITWSDNLMDLKLTNLQELDEISISGSGIKHIKIRDFPKLQQLSITGTYADSLSIENLNKIDRVLVLHCPTLKYVRLSKIDSIDELRLNIIKNLKDLDLNDINAIDRILIYENTALKHLDISKISFIDKVNFRKTSGIKSILLKNGTNQQLIFDSHFNPTYICADEDEIPQIIADLDAKSITGCTVNSYCPYANNNLPFTIIGKTRFNQQKTYCDSTSNEMTFPMYRIESNSKKGYFYGNHRGNFDINLDTGDYTITPLFEHFEHFKVTPELLSITFPDSISPYLQNFCVVPDGIYTDLEVTLYPLIAARPGFESEYRVIIKNKGNTVTEATLKLEYENNLMDFTNSLIPPDSTKGNSIYWSFSELNPFEEIDFTIRYELNTPSDSPPLNGDEIISFTSTVNSTISDDYIDNNSFTLNQTVVNSFDPNDKTCLEGNTILPEMVGNFVHYMIRFENTGTADAINIVVKDSIDPEKFDISTFQITDASHQLDARIQDNNIVEFIFKDIYLPFEDQLNDGFVVFKIKTKSNLKLGDYFENKAEIYFDYNLPIITNLTKTEIAIPTKASNPIDIFLSLTPNPATDLIKLSSSSQIKRVDIYNANGQMIKSLVYVGIKNIETLDVSNLSDGIYSLLVKTEKGTKTIQFIKT